MSTREQLFKACLGMLALADELKNIARRATWLASVSRTSTSSSGPTRPNAA
jgi:hypothetical protein